MDTVTNERIHGTTQEKPSDRWLQEKLHRFNPVPFETADRHTKKVANDRLISYEANMCSVPHAFVGKVIEIQDERNGNLRLFLGHKQIAEHRKATGKYQGIREKEHFGGIHTARETKVTQLIPHLYRMQHTQSAPTKPRRL